MESHTSNSYVKGCTNGLVRCRKGKEEEEEEHPMRDLLNGRCLLRFSHSLVNHRFVYVIDFRFLWFDSLFFFMNTMNLDSCFIQTSIHPPLPQHGSRMIQGRYNAGCFFFWKRPMDPSKDIIPRTRRQDDERRSSHVHVTMFHLFSDPILGRSFEVQSGKEREDRRRTQVPFFFFLRIEIREGVESIGCACRSSNMYLSLSIETGSTFSCAFEPTNEVASLSSLRRWHYHRRIPRRREPTSWDPDDAHSKPREIYTSLYRDVCLPSDGWKLPGSVRRWNVWIFLLHDLGSVRKGMDRQEVPT